MQFTFQGDYGFNSNKKQQSKRLYRQIADFGQDIVIGDAVCSRKQHVSVSGSPIARNFSVGSKGGIPATNENAVKIQTLERCRTDRTDSQMGTVVDMFEDKIQNAILTRL